MALGVVAMPVVLGAWFVGGPLQPGWAARAGTPQRLLAHSTSAVSTTAVTTTQAPIVLPSSAAGQGTTRLHRLSGGLARVVVSLRTQDAPPLGIQVVLNGRQFGTGVSMTDGSVALTPPQGTAIYRGPVTGLSGGNIAATLSDGHGDQIALSLALQISSSGQTAAQVSIETLATGSAQA
jgi:hypothetical protein